VKSSKLLAAIGLLATAQVAMSADSVLEAPGPRGSLKGTLLAPADAAGSGAPVVLMIPGSGPTDRDGNNPLGVKAAPYRLLAEALGQRGVSTVRIDKRGMFGSAGAIPDANQVVISDYAEDVHSWIDVVRKRTGATCVWVLGHSEGGLVALAAGRRPEGVCGLILVSAAGRPLGQVLREQFRANPANAPILQDADSVISKLEAGERVDTSSMHPALNSLFNPAVQGFLISTLSLDPAALISAYRGKILVLQGDSDLQVSVEDAKRLGKANPSAKVVILPNVNHVLKTVNGAGRQKNLAAYADPSLPLAPGVADAVADFVRGGGRADVSPGAPR